MEEGFVALAEGSKEWCDYVRHEIASLRADNVRWQKRLAVLEARLAKVRELVK